MPDNISIGHRAKQVEKSPRFDGVTGIQMLVDDQIDVSAGNDSGYVFKIESPWSSEDQVEWLLSKMSGYAYQPYQAERAILDPSAEIGDYVTVQGLFGGLFEDRNTFGVMFTSDIGAPQGEDVGHEYNYKSKADKRFERSMKQIAEEFEAQAEQIAGMIPQIGGDVSTFGWRAEQNGHFWYANGFEVMRCTRAGLKITGEVNATSGVIGGASINEDGLLVVTNANILSVNGAKIENRTIDSEKLDFGSVTGGEDGALAYGTVAPENTTFEESIDAGQSVYYAMNDLTPISSLWLTQLKVGEDQTQCGIKTFSFVDGNGVTQTINYVGPVS